VSTADVSDALGVGDGLSVAPDLGVVEADAVGVAFATGFELFPFAQTIKPRMTIPTTTAKTTRPEAPVFLT
jgi:hypothetical protein